MVSTNLLLKVLGGVTMAAVGTTGAYFLFRRSPDVVSEKALKSTQGWKVESTPSSITKDNTNVEINVQWKDGDISWASKIKGFIEKHDEKIALGIDDQAKDLKKSIGIDNKGNRIKNKNYNFNKFIESCRKHTTKSTKTSFESIIDLKKITTNNNKYQFQEADLKKLYDGTEEILKKLGITKTKLEENQDLKEDEIKNIKFDGKTKLTIEKSTTLKLKIENTDDTENYPEGLKFTLNPDKDIKEESNDGKPKDFLKANTNSEFKIKINGNSYSLEKK